MGKRPEEITLKISPAFRGFSRKPVFINSPIAVKVPIDYTIGKLVHELSNSTCEVCSPDNVNSNNIINLNPSFKIKSKLEKNNIRARLLRANRSLPFSANIKQAGLKNGDTVNIIFPGMPLISSPGKTLTSPKINQTAHSSFSFKTELGKPRRPKEISISPGLGGNPVTPPDSDEE